MSSQPPAEVEDPETRAERLAAEALRFAEQAREARERLKEIQMTINATRSAMTARSAKNKEESPEMEKSESIKMEESQPSPLESVPSDSQKEEMVGTESLIDGEVEEDAEDEEVVAEETPKELDAVVSTYEAEAFSPNEEVEEGPQVYSVPHYIPPVASVDDPFGGAHDDFCGVMDAFDICSVPEPTARSYGGVHVSPKDSIVASDEPAEKEEEVEESPVEEEEQVEEIATPTEEVAPVQEEEEEEEETASQAPVEEEQVETFQEETPIVGEESSEPVASEEEEEEKKEESTTEEADLAPQEGKETVEAESEAVTTEEVEAAVSSEEPEVEQAPSTKSEEEAAEEQDEEEVSEDKLVKESNLVDKLQATCGCTFWE
jgi:hypothetical protein